MRDSYLSLIAVERKGMAFDFNVLRLMFDTHCHLQTAQFDVDRDEIISVAEAAGVETFLVPAIDIESLMRRLRLRMSAMSYLCIGETPYLSLCVVDGRITSGVEVYRL